MRGRREDTAWRWVSQCAVLLCLCMCISAQAGQLNFTPQEQAYLSQKRTVTMCVDPDWAPFERLDENGTHVGIAADLIQLVVQRTGLDIKPLPVRTWDESLAASKDGRCQIMSFLNQTPERERWLRFTSPIFLDPNVLITREEHPYIPDLAALSNHTIALPRGTMVEERLRQDFPLLKVLTTDSEREAVELVSDRKVDLTMRSLIVAAYTIKQEGLFNLKIAGQVPQYTNQLRIGVLKDETHLLSVLDKAVSSISAQERELISNKHAAIQVQKGVDYTLAWKVALFAIVVLSAVGFWQYKLRQLERARTALAEATADQALQSQREQSQLTALISHEVRTALSVIDASANSLLLVMNTNDEASLLRISRIREGVQRLLNLSEQFLAKDRLERGTLKPKLETVDVLELCESISRTLDGKQRVVIFNEGDTHLLADPALLQVALHNLVSNALRYSPEGSPVRLEILDQKTALLIRITNSGVGIPTDEQVTIFSSYVRGTTGQGKPGAGLGLYLVRRVAELHHGAITLVASDNSGTTFELTLPRSENTTP